MTERSNEYSPRPFTGALSATDAIKGAQLLQANAIRLVKDAKLLLQAERYPSAAMLAVMALDELSRFFHPLTFAADHTPRQLAAGWKQFRSSQRDFPWSVFQSAGRFSLDSKSDADTNAMLAFIRNLGRGADFIEPGLWIEPNSLIAPELAASIVGTAELFCKNAIGSRGMEIWMETVGSLPRNATVDMALKSYQEMLASDGLADEAGMITRMTGRQNIAGKRFVGRGSHRCDNTKDRRQ